MTSGGFAAGTTASTRRATTRTRKNPPPADEHEGLHRYPEQRSGDEVKIPDEARPIIGLAMVKNLLGRNHRLLVLSVSPSHAHQLVELPDCVPAIKTIHRLVQAEVLRRGERHPAGEHPGGGRGVQAGRHLRSPRQRVRLHPDEARTGCVDVVLP